MKIKLKAKNINFIKEFNNKNELFEFVQKNIENIIFGNDEEEKFKWKILNSNNSNKFTIFDLVNMIDYDII